MREFEAELERAANARSPEERLLSLCRAWRRLPSTRVAILARACAAQLPRRGLDGLNQAEREAKWFALAGGADAMTLQALLATAWPARPREGLRRLEELLRIGPDPRTVGALLELDAAHRYPGTPGLRFWDTVYEQLLQWGSPEAAQRIPRDLHAASASPLEAARFARLFEPLIDRWKGKWPEEPPISDAAVVMLEKLEAALHPNQQLLRGLLAKVHADPLADAPRLVFADALSELGDPRGEFITLQFAEAAGEITLAQRERMQRLLAASGRAWFDGLERQVALNGVIRKGFLAEVRLETRTPDPAAGGWCTVSSLDLGGLALPLSRFLEHPHLTHVHSLRGLRGQTLQELANHLGPREFHLLEVSHLGERELAEPRWRTSTLRLQGQLDQIVWWLREASLALRPPVLQLAVELGFERIGPTLAELEALVSGSVIVEFAAAPPGWPAPWEGDWLLRFTRDERGRFSELEIAVSNDSTPRLDEALRSVAPGQLKSVTATTRLRRGPMWKENTARIITDSLRRQPELSLRLF